LTIVHQQETIDEENTNKNMTHEYKKFSEVFNKYRLKAQFETLAQFGEALAREGFHYEDSMFSRWKNGHREPKRRKLILAIIRVFIKYKSITCKRHMIMSYHPAK